MPCPGEIVFDGEEAVKEEPMLNTPNVITLPWDRIRFVKRAIVGRRGYLPITEKEIIKAVRSQKHPLMPGGT